VSAVIEMINGVDSITTAFATSAEKLKADAAELQDVRFDTIDAKGGDSRLARFDSDTTSKREAHVAAGKDAVFLQAFDDLRVILRNNLVSDIATEIATANAQAQAAFAPAPETVENARAEFTASGVTSITQVQAIRIDGLLQSILLVNRESLAYLRTISVALAGPNVPTLRIPATTGGFATVSAQSTAPVTVNFNGDITVNGMQYSTADKQALARMLAPLISQEMRQRASRLTALTGGART
jgi:hypothetical protein